MRLKVVSLVDKGLSLLVQNIVFFLDILTHFSLVGNLLLLRKLRRLPPLSERVPIEQLAASLFLILLIFLGNLCLISYLSPVLRRLLLILLAC